MRSAAPKKSAAPKLSALDKIVAILGGMSGRLKEIERRVAGLEVERADRQNRGRAR